MRSAFLVMSSLAPRAPGAAVGCAPCTWTLSQSLSHCRMICWPCGLPTRSAAFRGFHLSTQSWLPAPIDAEAHSEHGQQKSLWCVRVALVQTAAGLACPSPSIPGLPQQE